MNGELQLHRRVTFMSSENIVLYGTACTLVGRVIMRIFSQQRYDSCLLAPTVEFP